MTVRIGVIGCGGMGRAHVERIINDLSGGRLLQPQMSTWRPRSRSQMRLVGQRMRQARN